jgi:Domain of unknown function (DUF4145)
MESNQSYFRQIVRAGNWSSIQMRADTKKDYSIEVKVRVIEVGMDLITMLVSDNNYELWKNWWNSLVAWRGSGQRGTAPQKPQLETLFSLRTNYVDRSFALGTGNFVLIFDNTYSTLTDKTTELLLTQKWNLETPIKNLPIMNKEVIELPDEVSYALAKANECYLSGHYEQSSVMFRKAIDFAIRLKLLQSGLNEKELFDEQGNELSLSAKIKLLRSHDLLTQKAAQNLDDIKWFGDLGAHSKTRLVIDDVRDRVEPKVRTFLTGLALKP